MQEINTPPELGGWTAAEEAIAGGILCDATETLPLAREILQASDFGLEYARNIFRAACYLQDNHLDVDPVAILGQAEKDGLAIGTDWAKEQMKLFMTSANTKANAQIVKEAAIFRRGREIGWALENGSLRAQDALQQLQDAVESKASLLPTPSEASTRFFDYLNDVTQGKTRPFLSTGFPNLDEILGGGLVEQGLITLAGRPGQGKTVVGLAIAENVAAAGGRVLYESLEMSETQLMARRVSRDSGVAFSKLMAGTFDKNDALTWKQITASLGRLYNRQLIINDVNAKMEDIERHIRQAGKLDLIVIDHLGLIIPDKVTDSLYLPTTIACHSLKRIAKATKTPILLLCQLNRANTARADKRGHLSDLRNSGAIEEDSDAVIFIHRDAYYAPPEQQPKPWETQTMELNVEKNRHGTVGACYMDFIGMLCNIRPQQFTHTQERTPYDRGD